MNARPLAAAAAALLAVACGGSSSKSSARQVSYSGPTTVAPITTPAQAQSVASGTLASLRSVSGSVGSVNVMTGATGSTAGFTPREVARLAARYFPQVGAASVAAVQLQETSPCAVSGSATLSGSVRDPNNGGAFTGDYVQITLDACSDQPGQLASGSLRLEILSGNGDRFMDDPPVLTPGFTYRAQITVGDFFLTAADGAWFGMDGDVVLSLTKQASPAEVEESISGTSITFMAGQGGATLQSAQLSAPAGQAQYSNVRVEEYGSGFGALATAERSGVNAKLCASEIGGCVQVVTAPLLRQLAADANPSAGAMTLTAGNAQITVTALSAVNVDVTYDLDVTAPPPATTVHTTWACLDAPAPTCAPF